MASKIYTTKKTSKKLIKKRGPKRRTFGAQKPSRAVVVGKVLPLAAASNLVSDQVEELAHRQVLIIPSPSFLSAMTAAEPEMMMVAARRGSGSGRARAAVQKSAPMKRLLEEKRRGLEKLASLGLSSSRGLAWAESRVASRSSSRGARSGGGRPTAKNEYPGIKILEGLGALIVDREVVDVAAMAGASGSTVLENVFIPVGNPVAAGAAADALSPNAAWHLQNIDVQAARQSGLDGTSILLGVLDTGIDAAHQEFDGKIVHFAEFDMQGNLVSATPSDASGHGTHVSALAAGNNVGVAPAADLAVAAVLTYRSPGGSYGGYFAQILRGINWLLSESFRGAQEEPGVDLINASLGGEGYNDYYYSTLATARLTTGTMMVAAIGNSGPTQNRHGSPGNYDIVVGVGAIDPKNRVARFSDWGTVQAHNGLAKPDICAPGVGIWSARPGGGYVALNGTSMASPIVAGSVALLLQQDGSLRMNAPGLVNRLYEHVTPLQGVPSRGGTRGRLLLTGI